MCMQCSVIIRNYLYGSESRSGSGSGFGSFHQQAKKLRFIRISTILWLLNDILTFKTDVGILKDSAKKSRIRSQSMIWILSRIRIRNLVYGSKDPKPCQNVMDPEHCVYDWQCRIPSLYRWRSLELPIRGSELVLTKKFSFGNPLYKSHNSYICCGTHGPAT